MVVVTEVSFVSGVFVFVVIVGDCDRVFLLDVCDCVIGVLRRFQQSFSYITAVAACCMRRDMRSGFKCCQQ